MFIVKLVVALFISVAAMAAEDRDLSLLRTMGEPNSNTLYVFTAATCPHCAVFHREILPDIIQQYVSTGKAQIYFVDHASSDNKIATDISMLARCMAPAKSELFMNAVFNNQSEWMGNKNAQNIITRYASRQGLSQTQINNCLDNSELRKTMQEQWQNLAFLYHVRGIPFVALRQGNTVRTYSGSNKRYMLNGLASDFDYNDSGNTKTKRKN